MNGHPQEKPKRLHEHVAHHAKRFARGVHRHTKRLLIPHAENEYKPHALRPKALRLYSVSLIVVKVFVAGFLFLLYPSEGQFATYSASQILTLSNASRTGSGLKALSLNSKLNAAALAKAKDMFAKSYFAHTAPDGTKPWAFLDRAGYAYVGAGENLAIDFTDAQAVHTAFLNSPSHRANIMNAKYQEMGIAVLEGTMDGQATILLVEFFGTPYAVAKATTTAPTTQPTQSTPKLSDFRAGSGTITPKAVSTEVNVRTNVTATFKNTGRVTWSNSGANAVILQSANPDGRVSVVRDDSWKSATTVTKLKESKVAPGKTGSFTFVAKTPSSPTTTEESFAVTATSLGRITGGSIVLKVEAKPKPQLVETRITIAGVETSPPEPTPTETAPATAEPTPTPTPTPEPMPVPPVDLPTNVEPTPTQATVETVQASMNGERGIPSSLVNYSRMFFLILLGFLVAALLLNILIEIRIQHPHVIVQTLSVIILTGLAFAVRFHFLEAIGRSVRII